MPANEDVTMESTTMLVKNSSLMRPADNVTVASTIPGPPRAFSATAKFFACRFDSPAPRAAGPEVGPDAPGGVSKNTGEKTRGEFGGR